MASSLTISAASGTHVGFVRRRNEDSHLQGDRLFVVADGLGGHVAGDIASVTAVGAMAAYDRAIPASEVGDALGRAVSEADNALKRRVRAEPRLAGMGTTLVALLKSDVNVAALTNVGDSRAYLVRKEADGTPRTRQISEDHTYSNLLAHADQIPNLGEKLTRFLDGRRDGRSPDVTLLHLFPGDRILLCSDGLTSYVSAASIEAALIDVRSPRECVSRLIDLSLTSGGMDNVTAIILDLNVKPGT